jgi:hypothetical protein
MLGGRSARSTPPILQRPVRVADLDDVGDVAAARDSTVLNRDALRLVPRTHEDVLPAVIVGHIHAVAGLKPSPPTTGNLPAA